jgi:hypothetical protein
VGKRAMGNSRDCTLVAARLKLAADFLWRASDHNDGAVAQHRFFSTQRREGSKDAKGCNKLQLPAQSVA